ncbi:MAG: hypothetical protein IJW25_01040 [Clostridia bacterium]|nr:hypothetical protein [Clostridia bacterium]
MTKTKIKQIFISLFVVLAFMLAQNSLLIGLFSAYNTNSTEVFASTAVTGKPTVELTSEMSSINAGFSSTSSGSTSTTSSYYTGSTSIRTPTNWTKDSSVSYTKLKIGSIDISKTENFFNDEEDKTNGYGISRKESNKIYLESMAQNSEKYALMINALSTQTNFGYTSKSLSLKANSYYSVTVNYLTQEGAAASIYMIGDQINEFKESNWELKDTAGKWESVTFWFETSSTKKLDVQIGLYLGAKSIDGKTTSNVLSSGYAIFDNIKINQYSKAMFDLAKTNGTNNQVISLKNDVVTSGDGFVIDGNFENGLSNWASSDKNTGGSSYLVDLSTFEGGDYSGVPADAKPGTNYQSNTETKAMMISSSSTATNLKESKEITIKQNTTYRISVWAIGELTSGNPEIILSGKIPGTLNTDMEEETVSQSFTSLSTNTNYQSNGWQEYVFYVVGNPLYDSTLKLSLGFTSAKGYILFDDITTQIISTAEKNDGTSVDSNSKTVEIYKTSSASVPNGYFNFTTSVEQKLSYPLPVSNWTHNESELGNQISGIINTKSAIFDAHKINFDSPTNPAQISSVADDTNNILMLRNKNEQYSYQSYTTESTITLNKSTYYRFNVDVNTQDIKNKTSGINVTIKNNKNIILAQFNNVITNNAATNNWETLEVYFYTGDFAQEINITLSLGSASYPTAGFAFFDNCELTSNDANGTAINETSFADVKTGKFVKKVNLSTESFDNYGDLDTSTNLYAPLFWNIESQAGQEHNVASGILTQENIYNALGQDEFEPTLTSALMLRHYEDTYSKATFKLSYTFDANAYYKVSAKIKTVGLTQSAENKVLDDDNNEVPYGANFYIEQYNKTFKAINTVSESVNAQNPFDDEENVFVEYTFYINTTDSFDPTFVLELGNEESLVSGIALFDDFAITVITEDDYKNATAIYENEEDYPEYVINIANESATSNTDENNPTFTPDYTVWLAIPTVIIALAVVVAIVGYLVRKSNENKTETVNVSVSYDRSETLLKDMDRRHRKSAISHRLKLLYEELETTEKTLAEERQEHKKQLDAYQTAKEIAAQDSSVQLQEPDTRFTNFEKTEEQLVKNIEGIKADIKLLEEEQKQLIEKEKARNNKSTRNIVTRNKTRK